MTASASAITASVESPERSSCSVTPSRYRVNDLHARRIGRRTYDPAMELDGANVVVTGGARGIGAALVRRFHAAGANVVAADVARRVAGRRAARTRRRRSSPTCPPRPATWRSSRPPSPRSDPSTCSSPTPAWRSAPTSTMAERGHGSWRCDVNVNAHRWAAKHLLDGWLARGSGYFCSTASAAGLLAQIGSLGVHGHQARRRRLRRVAVDHLRRPGDPRQLPVPAGGQHRHAQRRRPARAPAVVRGGRRRARARRGRRRSRSRRSSRSASSILPHPEVAEYVQRKASDEESLAGRDAPAAGADRRGLGAGLRSTG